MRKLAGFLVVIAVLAGAWSAAWFAAASVAGRQVDAFVAAEAAEGRVWACPDRRVGGYPLALAVTCREPSFTGRAMGETVSGRVARLVATVALSHPTRIAVALTPPFAYGSSDGRTAVDGSWKHLSFGLSPPWAPRTLSLQGAGVVVHGRFPGGREGGGAVAAVDASLTADPADNTLSFAATMAGTPLPILDDLVGGSAPVDATVAGRLDHTDVGDVRTPPEAMERWRENGGTVTISTLDVRRATSSVAASGTLGLDTQHRLKGRLDASFVGLEPILARYGIGGNVAALGSLLGTIFGGGHAPRPATPGALALPISFGNGRLGIGPITTAVALDPLY